MMKLLTSTLVFVVSLIFSVQTLGGDVIPKSFLVLIEDAEGNSMCNGIYIGQNQILTSGQCSSWFFPSWLDFYAVFHLPDGSTVKSLLKKEFSMTKSRRMPLGKTGALYFATEVPEGIQPVSMADELVMKELQSNPDTEYFIQGYNLSQFHIDLQEFTLFQSDQCHDSFDNGINEFICLRLDPDPTICNALSYGRKGLGAPVYAIRKNGEAVLVAMNYYENCSGYPVLHQFEGWANVVALNDAGVNVTTALDVGLQKVGKPSFAILNIQNDSDKVVEFSDFSIRYHDAYKIVRNTCTALQPNIEDSCRVIIQLNPLQSRKYIDVLTFTVNGASADVFLAMDVYGDYRLPGDYTSTWNSKGWIETDASRWNTQLKTSYQFAENPRLVRNKHLYGPATISVTYKTSGQGQMVFSLVVNKKSLNDKDQIITLGPFLPGTNGEWVTHEIEVTDSGAHQVILQRSMLSPTEEAKEDIEIKAFCINGCFGDKDLDLLE